VLRVAAHSRTGLARVRAPKIAGTGNDVEGKVALGKMASLSFNDTHSIALLIEIQRMTPLPYVIVPENGCIHAGVVSEDPPGKFRQKSSTWFVFQVSSF
jgi:hypothetical protein